MGFATAYLEKRTIYNTLIEGEPSQDTRLIVIVPSFDETGISALLDSLALCNRPEYTVEVIIGVNAPRRATDNQLTNNSETLKIIESWIGIHNEIPFRLFAFDIGRSTMDKWGAGLARKVLMDEAVRRFNYIGNSQGIIASLDADCLVSRNYLTSLYEAFSTDENLNGVSIRFEHIIPTEPENYLIRSAIIDYELHLRYYYQALKYSGYPDVFYTVGSAFAVKASAYVKVGGMNRRQAGEDFYFIQKMIPLGGFSHVNNLVVYPSARISHRVPFGTGPAIQTILNNPSNTWLTYNPGSFIELSHFISLVPDMYGINRECISAALKTIPAGIERFLTMNNIIGHLQEIQENTSGKLSFEKRFFRWFNMFQVVKYLNYVHSGGIYEKIPIADAAQVMLGMISGNAETRERNDLLKIYRQLEE